MQDAPHFFDYIKWKKSASCIRVNTVVNFELMTEAKSTASTKGLLSPFTYYVTQANKRDITCQNTFSQKSELKVYKFPLSVAGELMARSSSNLEGS